MHKPTERSLFALCLALSLAGIVQAQPIGINACPIAGNWIRQQFSFSTANRSYPAALSSPLLLTDGRVMLQFLGTIPSSGDQFGDPEQSWFALQPSSSNCYSLTCANNDNATLNTAAFPSLSTILGGHYGPWAFAAALLASGNVLIEGGEGNVDGQSHTSMGALLNTATGAWTSIAPPPNWTHISDAPATVLEDKTLLIGNPCGDTTTGYGETAIFNESALSANPPKSPWTVPVSQPHEWTSEASFTLLPGGQVLFAGTCRAGQACSDVASPLSPNNAEMFTPGTSSQPPTWRSIASTPVQLYTQGTWYHETNSCLGQRFGDQGPAALLPNGMYFALGGSVTNTANVTSNYTAQYNPATGSWIAGPQLPNINLTPPNCLSAICVTVTYSLTAWDEGSVVLPNGNLLFATFPQTETLDDYVAMKERNAVYYLEYVPNANPSLAGTLCYLPDLPSDVPVHPEFLTLPNGDILVANVSWSALDHYYIYQHGLPSSLSQASSQAPKITSVSTQLSPGSTYTIQGTGFNGVTQSSYFGDDFQNATNYPLVRITNNSTQHVFYARTHDHSSMGVATGAASVTTSFEVPASIETGASELVVVANGIASSPVAVTIQ